MSECESDLPAEEVDVHHRAGLAEVLHVHTGPRNQNLAGAGGGMNLIDVRFM